MKWTRCCGRPARPDVYKRQDRIFVKAITDISHAMGKRVIAEFVENEAILHIRNELGVDYAQGYHIGRPAPLPGKYTATPNRYQA